jgi:hypothetical protein
MISPEQIIYLIDYDRNSAFLLVHLCAEGRDYASTMKKGSIALRRCLALY